jgi:tRNA (guanine-N7-)-methyltransferase
MRNDPYANAPRLPEGEPLDPRALVGASSAIELEIGPGRGGFVFERVELDPAARIIGLEIRRKWATIVDQRIAARGFASRARVFAEDARGALPRFVPHCCSVVYVNFPDPWWKKKHQKRLVLLDPVVEQVARVLVPGGELFIQTDVEHRAEEYAAVVERSGHYVAWNEPARAGLEGAGATAHHAGGEHARAELLPGSAARVAENPHGARSPREHRAIADGLPIFRLRYRTRS